MLRVSTGLCVFATAYYEQNSDLLMPANLDDHWKSLNSPGKSSPDPPHSLSPSPANFSPLLFLPSLTPSPAAPSSSIFTSVLSSTSLPSIVNTASLSSQVLTSTGSSENLDLSLLPPSLTDFITHIATESTHIPGGFHPVPSSLLRP